MKKSTIKLIGSIIIVLNFAIFFCEMKDVKIIFDETAAMGVELDFSEAHFSLTNQDEAPNKQQDIAMP